MASILELMGHVQQQGEMGRQRGQQSRLTDLASQAYSAPADQRRELVGQAIGTDPSAGFALGQNLEAADEQRQRGLSNMARMLTAAPAQYRDGIYQRMKPSLTERYGLGNLPAAYDETVDGVVQQLASLGGGDSAAPAGYRQFELMAKAAGLEPGTPEYQRAAAVSLGTEGRASSAGYQQVKFTGPDGRPRVGVMNGRTGRIDTPDGLSFDPSMVRIDPTPQQYGEVQPGGMVQFTDANGQPITFDEGVPAHVREQILANPAAFDAVPSGATASLPPAAGAPGGVSGVGGVNPFVGRSPEEQAALTTAAEQRARLQFLPEQQTIETAGAVDRARQLGQVESDLAKSAGESKARLALDQTTARQQRVDRLVESILPRVGYATAGFASLTSALPGTPAHDMRKDLQTLQAIAGFDELNAMRASSPTGGALGNVTERELAFLQSVVSNIENSQSPEQLRRNLLTFQREVRNSWARVAQAYEQDYGAGRQAQGQQPAQDIDALLEMYR